MSQIDPLSTNPTSNEASSADTTGSSDPAALQALRDAQQRVMETSGSDEIPAVSPESLLGGAAEVDDAQAAGRQEFVEGILKEMLLENLKKAGQPSEESLEGW